MVNVALTPRERALMLALMTLGGSASNPELDRRLGDTLDGAPRRRLNSSGLVTSEKQGRAYHHTLTEDGWAWCVAELSGTAPARGGASLARALYGVLDMIKAYLDATDLSLAEFVVTAREKGTPTGPSTDVFADSSATPPTVAPSAVPAANPSAASSAGSLTASPADALADSSAVSLVGAVATPSAVSAADGALAAPSAVPPATSADLEAAIREAYWRLAREPQDWVRLTALRPLLGDAPREQVDEALRRLERRPDVHLVPEADQKTLTDADRQAAVLVSGVSKHLLAIDAR